MKPEQRVIVDWMQRTMETFQMNPKQWAEKAGVSPTSVTRAMGENYTGVTTLPVLDRLARAVGVPSPLDALRPGYAVVCDKALGDS